MLQGESEHHKGEFSNQLQQLVQLENLHSSAQGLQQRRIDIWVDAQGQGGGSEGQTFRLQKGIEWVQEV